MKLAIIIIFLNVICSVQAIPNAQMEANSNNNNIAAAPTTTSCSSPAPTTTTSCSSPAPTTIAVSVITSEITFNGQSTSTHKKCTPKTTSVLIGNATQTPSYSDREPGQYQISKDRLGLAASSAKGLSGIFGILLMSIYVLFWARLVSEYSSVPFECLLDFLKDEKNIIVFYALAVYLQYIFWNFVIIFQQRVKYLNLW